MKKSELLFTAVKPPLDFISLVFAAVCAYAIRYAEIIQEVRPVVFDLPFKSYFSLSVAMALLWLIAFAFIGLYSFREIKRFRQEVGRVFIGCLAGLAIVLGIMVFSRYLFDSRMIILTAFFLAFIFVSIARLIIKIIQKFAYTAGFGVHRIAIIGNAQSANGFAEEFKNHPSMGYRMVAMFEDFDDHAKRALHEMAQNDKVDEILQLNPNYNKEKTTVLLDFINDNHLDYKYAADLVGTRLTNIEMTTISGMPIVEVKKTKLDGWGRIIKRIFDIVVSLLLIIILSPVMVCFALLIKLTSRGPILFKYYRIGQHGKKFTYFKFRSMIADAHKFRFDESFVKSHQNVRNGTPMIKFKNDPRITPLGKFIRRFSIDELPELFLVISGKMSLVGPRPHEIEEVGRYELHHKKVLTIKPGITGMAQVSGRSDLNFEDEVKLDTYYIENWSLGLDLLILLKTPIAVIKKRNTV